ncbi:MAG: glutamate--tRNA ligase [Caulobacteraceae bacterium]|nr:glutamate--tRNA ligase [Caulobacteraceae bacterium]
MSALSPADRPVVTRVAPSPTGMMHIGTARTALFNWLFARHCGGTFLLRIEDTDRERSTEAAVQAIFDGLDWLGLKADAPPVFQATRAELHRQAALSLLDTGRAYRCYMTVEELEIERQKARAEGRAIRSVWRDHEAPAGSNAPYVIRFRGPLEGETIVNDLIKGPVRFQNKELDDLVLLRSDGMPTYNLAVVVDDHDMGITHVIRGDDHLSNAARQSLIYEALGWAKPAFAHLPLIHGPDGAKLSKRHGAQAVSEFADMGYLPEGMRNYLARLGWGHGDDEIFDDDQAIAWFNVADVVSAPARLDWDKLNFINGQYIRQADDARLADLTLDIHRSRDVHLHAGALEALTRAIPLVKDGAKTILQLADLTLFVLKARPLELDPKTKNLLTDETRARLGRLREHLAREAAWDIVSLEQAVRTFSESEGVGIGKFGPALRGVLSGGAPAPDLASTLTALTREESLGRIDDALSQSQQRV